MPTTGKYQHAFRFCNDPAPDAISTSSDVSTSTTPFDELPSSSLRSNGNSLRLAEIADPGRTTIGIMEDPNSPDTVAPPLCCDSLRSCLPSRPGPVFGSREGVFQHALSGMYLGFPVQSPSPDASQPFSCSQPPRPALHSSPTAQQCHLYYQNAGGMNGTISDYLHGSSGECCDFIALTETWLKDHTLSAHIFGPEYETFRCNRGPDNSKKTEGGGVLIAARKSFKPRRIHQDNWKTVEQVWVSLKLSDRVLYLCAVYFPPDRTYDKDLYKAHLDSVRSIVERARPIDDIFVVGDFNLPKLNWTHSRNGFLFPDPDRSQFHSCARDLLDSYSASTLQQINHVTNEDGRSLDLCFVSVRDTAPEVTAAAVPLAKVVARHPALIISVDGSCSTEYREEIALVRYNFRRADFESLSRALRGIEWSSVLDPVDIDLAVDTYTSILGRLIEQFVPKIRKVVSHHLPWQTQELRHLKTQKRAAFKVSNGSVHLRDYYLRINHSYQRLSRRCFANYQRKMEKKLKTDPKKFWKFVNESRRESGLPTSMRLADDEGDDADKICQLFAKKFAGVFCAEPITDEEVRAAAENVPRRDELLASIEIDEGTIQAAASKLKHSCSPGPDGIPSTLLKRCSSSLSAPLLHLFRLSLSSGKFPVAWKQAYMFPVHKKGDRTNVENYRGISALCATSKLLELVVIDPVFSHCRQDLADEQHGFFPKRSTATNLLCFTESIINSFDAHSQTDAIYTDLSAAFDKINHRIAVAKLERLGFRGSLLAWFKSYLTGRSLRVRIGDALSDIIDATSGIAQGSHLGPVVFLFYFNDVNYTVTGPRLVYADDLKLFARIDNSNDAEALQRDLDRFAGWCDVNRMILNPGKCQSITFSRRHFPVTFDYRINDTSVERVTHVKDLGVILDTQLTFKQHLSYIIAKASRQLGLVIRMTRKFTDIYCLKTLYCSLVRSTLEYCSTVWSPHYNNAVCRLESIQRRFVRYALRQLPWTNPLHLPPYEQRCRLIDLDTLQLRRDLARAMTSADVLLGRIDCPDLRNQIQLRVPTRQLRHTPALEVPFRRTNYSANGAINGLKRAFNKVSSVFSLDVSRTTLRFKFVSLLRSLLRM